MGRVKFHRYTTWMALVWLCLLAPQPIRAQTQVDAPVPEPQPLLSGVMAGIVGGWANSRQIWTGSVTTEYTGGVSLGGYLDVPTPVRGLAVRAEVGYVRRGSLVWEGEGGAEGEQGALVRSHYLTFPIHGKAGLKLGPVSAYVLAGPTIDILLSTGCGSGICSVIREERPNNFSMAAGFGAGIDIPRGYRIEVEFRHTEGLTDAYVGEVSGVRNRSQELLVRIGLPLERLVNIPGG